MSVWLPGLVLAGALLQAPGPSSPCADPGRATPNGLRQLQACIVGVLRQTRTPGAGVALVTRDSVLWAGGLGKADVASGRDATGQTLFRIGSTAKAFTALVTLMLEREGKLALEDPIRRYIPEIRFENRWEATDPVRIVNALEHTTGFDDWSDREGRHSDPTPLTLRQGLDFSPATRVSRWRPGTRVAYSNTGPALVGYIIEKLEGKPFEQVVQERLFDPIGMRTATYLFPDTTRVTLATLYATDGRTPVPYWHLVTRPSGSVNASAEDMAAYLQFLLGRGTANGRSLLPPSAIDRLERGEHSLAAEAGLRVGYGLYLARYVDGGRVWIGHTGAMPGALTMVGYLPEDGVGFACMINAAHWDALWRISRLLRGFVTRRLPRPPSPPPPAAMPEAARTRYAGWYRQDNPRHQIHYFVDRTASLTRVTVSDSALVVRPVSGAPVAYVPVAGMTFRRAHDPIATLALVDDSRDGRPLAIERVSSGVPQSLVRVPAVLALAELGLAGASRAAVALALLAIPVGLVLRLLGRLRRRSARPSHARTL